MKDVTGAHLTYQVDPDHARLVDEVIDWYDGTAAGIERTAMPSAADEFALKRWAAHGCETNQASLGDTGSWTQLNERDLTEVEHPALPDGFRFRTADEAESTDDGKYQPAMGSRPDGKPAHPACTRISDSDAA